MLFWLFFLQPVCINNYINIMCMYVLLKFTHTEIYTNICVFFAMCVYIYTVCVTSANMCNFQRRARHRDAVSCVRCRLPVVESKYTSNQFVKRPKQLHIVRAIFLSLEFCFSWQIKQWYAHTHSSTHYKNLTACKLKQPQLLTQHYTAV